MKEQDGAVKWFNCEFYPRHKVMNAVLYHEKVLPRLRQDEVTFFTPWGARKEHARFCGERVKASILCGVDPEYATLMFLAGLYREICEGLAPKRVRWILLGADLYATRINHVYPEWVDGYMKHLEAWVKQEMPSAEFYHWSTFDQVAEHYREIARDNLCTLIGLSTRERAERTAQYMGGNADEYLVERIAEALFVEHHFHPIKISLVPKHKDAKVDCELPRLYLVPEKLRAPWRKSAYDGAQDVLPGYGG